MKSLHLLRNIASTARTRSRNFVGVSKQTSFVTFSSRRTPSCVTHDNNGFLCLYPIANNRLTRPFSSTAEASISLEEEPRRFDDLDIHPNSLKALKKNGFETMTEIQEKTFSAAADGQDVLGRARTGTGKTLSFLLPALERTLRNPIPGQVNMLILSPTRELAMQIQSQAKMLVSAHDKSITSQAIVGGSSKRDDIRRFHEKIPTVLVATPGRLKDHLLSTEVNGTPLAACMEQLQVLVLDEMDRMLDVGFRREVEEIVRFLPRERQTLLFSATLPPDVRRVLRMSAKPDFLTVDCIEDEDPTTHTNEMTEQFKVILPSSRFMTGTVEFLLSLVDDPKNKVMCFFPMTSLVQLYSNLFSHQLGRRVSELHGKMDQRARSRISQRFRNSKSGTLFTSDVSARGVDYPDVTHVVQFGASSDRETYIHRLGRTGRAGKKGKGILLLPDMEVDFLDDLGGLDIKVDEEWQSKMNGPPSKQVMNELGPIAQDVKSGRAMKLASVATDSYHAMVGYYLQRSRERRQRGGTGKVVDTINGMVRDIGLPQLPGISSKRAEKLRIGNVKGLNIEYGWDDKADWTMNSWIPKSSGRPDGHARRPRNSRSETPQREFRSRYADRGKRFGDRNFDESRGSRGSSDRDDNERRGRARQPRRKSWSNDGRDQDWKKDALGLDRRNSKKSSYGYSKNDSSNRSSFNRWDSSNDSW